MALSRGFSLIEILLVLAVAGLVLAFSVPALERYVERARVAETVVALSNMSETITKFEIAKGALPDGLDEVGYSGKADPWGNPYEYVNLHTAKGNGQARQDKKLRPLNSDFDLYSIGRDRQTHASLGHARSRDDVVRARDGRFIGTAEEFDP